MGRLCRQLRLAAVETIEVNQGPAPPTLVGAAIDSPTPQKLSDIPELHVVGWVLGRSSPARSVQVLHNGIVLREVPVSVARPDLAAAFADNPAAGSAGYHAMIGVLGLPVEFELSVRAVLEDGTTAEIGTIRARHQQLRSGFEPRLQPIIVSCLGRSGTTWLMQLLAAHPSIVVYERYPYESSAARYWAHVLKVLLEPGSLIQSTDRDAFADPVWNVPYNPLYDESISQHTELARWLGNVYMQRVARLCQQSIEEWYTMVARAQGQHHPLYFAEKHMWPDHLRLVIHELYPGAKEIFLVRDFRDMVFSILAFDEKRGYAGFRRPPGKSDEQYIREDLREAAVALCRSWKERRDSSHLVRYEDLALHPAETVGAMLDYLGLTGADAVQRALASDSSPELTSHRTSTTREESIGRWRGNEDERLRAVCEETFADLLDEFGYSEVETAAS
jgi:hypothetical protein